MPLFSNRNVYLCAACERAGTPRMVSPGNFGIELLLWFLFVLPGLLYSLHRATNKRRVCRYCGGDTMVPADSPRAMRIASDRVERDSAVKDVSYTMRHGAPMRSTPR